MNDIRVIIKDFDGSLSDCFELTPGKNKNGKFDATAQFVFDKVIEAVNEGRKVEIETTKEEVMYDIVWFNDNAKTKTVLHSKLTIKQASEKRDASGDVVVLHGTDTMVNPTEWAWGWELKDSNSYVLSKWKNRDKK